MKNFILRLLGRKPEIQKQLESKSQEAHQIKNDMQANILRIKRKVDKINLQTYKKLQEVSTDLESVTYKIAVATGAKKRGLK